MTEEYRMRNEIHEMISFYEFAQTRGDVKVLRSEVIDDLHEIINGVGEPVEEKIECPYKMCAYSFVGDSRAQALINHYLSFHLKVY